MKQRGLTVDPKLAVGDGALGFWKALPQVFAATRPQRCWVHKTANVLDKLPRRLQPDAKDRIHQIWMAPTRKAAEQLLENQNAHHDIKILRRSSEAVGEMLCHHINRQAF